MYIPVSFDNLHVAALVDTGSSICDISNDLFNELPGHLKLSIEHVQQEIRLANNNTVELLS